MSERTIEWLGIIFVIVAFGLLLWWGNNIGIERMNG